MCKFLCNFSEWGIAKSSTYRNGVDGEANGKCLKKLGIRKFAYSHSITTQKNSTKITAGYTGNFFMCINRVTWLVDFT